MTQVTEHLPCSLKALSSVLQEKNPHRRLEVWIQGRTCSLPLLTYSWQCQALLVNLVKPTWWPRALSHLTECLDALMGTSTCTYIKFHLILSP
jgi:hypothetical protein